MVDAEKSGVMFTSHPSTGDPQITIEAAWGLGEAVVSGTVSPDNYVYDRERGAVDEVTVADKKVEMVKDAETGETVTLEVDDERRNSRVLSDEEIAELVELGKRVEDHYGTPQDVEWAIYAGDIYMLQSRPITTIQEDAGSGRETDTGESAENIAGKDDVDDDTSDGVAANGAGDRDDASDDADVLVNGLGASPGVVSGAVRIVHKLDHLDQVQEGDVMVTEMTMPDMVPAMKRAAGIITDEGGMTSHAAIISRELGVPAVVGTGNGTRVLNDGQNVTLDGDKGTVRAGATADAESGEEFEPVEAARPETPSSR